MQIRKQGGMLTTRRQCEHIGEQCGAQHAHTSMPGTEWETDETTFCILVRGHSGAHEDADGRSY